MQPVGTTSSTEKNLQRRSLSSSSCESDEHERLHAQHTPIKAHVDQHIRNMSEMCTTGDRGVMMSVSRRLVLVLYRPKLVPSK